MWKVNGRQTSSDGKSSHCLWQGELKMWKVNGRQMMDAKWWQKLTLPLARWAKKKSEPGQVFFYKSINFLFLFKSAYNKTNQKYIYLNFYINRFIGVFRGTFLNISVILWQSLKKRNTKKKQTSSQKNLYQRQFTSDQRQESHWETLFLITLDAIRHIYPNYRLLLTQKIKNPLVISIQNRRILTYIKIFLGGVLTPLSAIFQLYQGNQF